jgi:hypothetical protein
MFVKLTLGEEEDNEVQNQIVVADNIRVSQMGESMKAEFESVLNININNNNRLENNNNQEVVVINSSLDNRRFVSCSKCLKHLHLSKKRTF